MCNDGTQTGIGLNPDTSPDKLYIYLEGGGACGNYQTCYQLKTASIGPFGGAEFDATKGGFDRLLTRSATENPFFDWTLLYVPYCTGGLHGGIRTVDYTSGNESAVYHHMGHINVLRELDRLATTWPSLDKLAVSGSSAGGYGALINYGDARLRWPAASTRSYLIDDSGPPLENQ